MTNRGCDDLKITSGPGILPAGYTCDVINWPVTLLPDSSMVVRFHYTPSIAGTFEAYPHFETERSGKKGVVDLILHADTKAGSSILSLITPTLSLGPLPICAVDSQEIVYTNTGCDNLFVTPSGLIGDNDYLSSSGLETKLSPGDTIRIWVKIVPQQKGLRIASYNLHIRKASGEVFDTIVSIAASVTEGTKQLQCPVTAIDFPPISLCPNSMDTTVLLHNNGCDTLWVTGFGLSGSGFSVTPEPPFFIEPSGSKDIIIHGSLITFDHRSTNTGAVFITSTSDIPLAPIVLNQSYIYPGNYPVRIQVPTKANVGDTISIKIFADSLPYGLNEFVADLSIGNSDLLSFLRYEGPNTLASMNGDQIRFTGNPILTNVGLLAEFFYKVFLTADTATKINFSGVHFNPTDVNYEHCIATPLSPNIEEYGSIFRCGEHTISDVMRGDAPMRISSVHPNPTSGDLTVSIDMSAASDIEAAIIDQLGRELKSVTAHLESGRQQLSIDVVTVASGIYHLRIKTATTSVEMSFIKTR